MNDPLPDQASAQEVAATPTQSAAVARAKELADIAAQSAKFAGIDVTITPCPGVFIQVDGPPNRSGAWASSSMTIFPPLLPTNGWQALKIDPATRSVVLQLFGRRGYRAHVVRILTCLIFDRLRNERDRFEPRIAVLCQPEAPVRLTSVPEPPVYPFPDRKPSESPRLPSAGCRGSSLQLLLRTRSRRPPAWTRSSRVRSLARTGRTRRARAASQWRSPRSRGSRRRRPGESPAR